MNKTVRNLAAVSLFLVVAAFILGRFGFKAGTGFVPVADPAELMFPGEDPPGAVWIGIAMILLLAGLSTSLATIKFWIQNRSDMKGFSRHATKIIPR